MIRTTPADRFDFNRLHGSEKYNLNNMELRAVNFPDVVKASDITSQWSDRIRAEWQEAMKSINGSQYTADAFFAGVSDDSLIKFAQDIAGRIGFKKRVTGVRVVRFTNVSSGYPVFRLDIAHGGRKLRHVEEPGLDPEGVYDNYGYREE